MENHLNRIAVLFAAYSFAALVLSITPGLTDDTAKAQKELKSDNGVRIDLKLEDYRGKMVQLDGDNTQKTIVWLVGADGKRRLIPNRETYKCLKGIGLEDPMSVRTEILERLPNIENARATCGTNTMRPNEALQQGSYLQAGVYKLLLTDRDLVQTKNGNQVWSTGIGAAQLILQTDGNLVEYDSQYKAVWASRTDGRTAGLLILGNDSSLRLYDDKMKLVWQP